MTRHRQKFGPSILLICFLGLTAIFAFVGIVASLMWTIRFFMPVAT